MTTRWRTSRWLPSRGVCGGSGGGPGGPPSPAPFSVDLVKITPSPLELGASLPVTVDFNTIEINQSGPLLSAQIADDDGNPPVNILGQVDPVPTGGMGYSYVKTAIGATVDFTYTADDGSGPEQDVEQYVWLPRVYLGVAAIPGAVNEAFIEGLSDSELRADQGIDRTGVVWTAGEYIWVAFPQAFNPTAALDFLVTIGGSGFPGGFLLDTAGVSVTPNTPSGVPLLYDVWRSTGAGLGLTVDVAVSP
jgi:hypothetical protein